MQPERQSQWQVILQMTEQLQQLSNNEDWSAMAELESSRKNKLEVFFATPVSEAESAELAQGIKQMLSSDQQLVSAGIQQQKEISSAMQKIATSKKAVKAYSHFQD